MRAQAAPATVYLPPSAPSRPAVPFERGPGGAAVEEYPIGDSPEDANRRWIAWLHAGGRLVDLREEPPPAV